MSTLKNKQITRNNKIITHNNKLVTGCGGVTCTGCVGGSTATATVQVIISGWTVCTACGSTRGGFDYKVVSGTINGTFCLPATAGFGHCRWATTLSSPIVIDIYDSTDNSCTGSITSTITITDIIFEAQTGSGGQITLGSGFTDVPGGVVWSAFGNNTVLSPNCVDGTYSNQDLGCGLDAFNRIWVGTGGSASVVMGGC